MRLHEREQPVSIAKTHLEMALHDYQWPREKGESLEEPNSKDIDDVEMLRLVTMEIRGILLDMDPKVERAERFSNLKDLIYSFKTDHPDPEDPERVLIGLTDIELLQALHSYCSSKLKWMLRYERHGDYDKASGLADG